MAEKAGIPVAVYLRCSSGKQELSIDQQRIAVKKYCDRKRYEIIKEYKDEGKSGSKDTAKRVEYHQMIRDSNQRNFKIVVCYDAARFTRLDSLDANADKKTLRDNGMTMDTVKEGLFDWTTVEGRQKDFALCEGNRQHALNSSVDSLRGRGDVARLGWWPHAEIPFGFDKEYHFEDGEIQIIPRRKRRTKGDTTHIKLVINEHEAAIVRSMYCDFVGGESLRSLVSKLNSKGIPGTDGGTWNMNSLAKRLTDKTYIGIVVIGQREIADELDDTQDDDKKKRKRKRKERHNKAEYIELKGNCPEIVTQELFDSAQARFANNKAEKRKDQPKRAGLLSGLLVCQNCGYRMVKRVLKKRTAYVCSSGSIRKDKGCRQWHVWEDEEWPMLLDHVLKGVDDVLLDQIIDTPKEEGNPALGIARTQVVELTKKAALAIENASQSPPNLRQAMFTVASKAQEAVEAAKERLAELERVSSPDKLQELKTWYAEVRPGLSEIQKFVPVTPQPGQMYPRTLKTVTEHVDPTRLRTFFIRLGVQMSVTFGENEDKSYHAPKHVPISREIESHFVSNETGLVGRKVSLFRRTYASHPECQPR